MVSVRGQLLVSGNLTYFAGF